MHMHACARAIDAMHRMHTRSSQRRTRDLTVHAQHGYAPPFETIRDPAHVFSALSTLNQKSVTCMLHEVAVCMQKHDRHQGGMDIAAEHEATKGKRKA